MVDSVAEAVHEVDNDGQDADADTLDEDSICEDDVKADTDGDDLKLQSEDDSSGFGLRDWAFRTPEGSYREMNARDYWDPEGGGKNRLAFHVTDLIGERGIPNAVGLVIAVAEMYYNLAQHGGDTAEDDSQEQQPLADQRPDIKGANL